MELPTYKHRMVRKGTIRGLRILLSYLFYLFPMFAVGVAQAETNADQKIKRINEQVRKKLDFYNEAFPKIQFVYLKNGEWRKSLQALEFIIGYQATSLDYQHPPELRKDLLLVMVARIRMILVAKITSSSLFKVGENPAAKRKYVCVITLDPASIVMSNKAATQYFIDLPPQMIASLPASRYIDKDQHLDFAIDHEVYHCLDTFYFGGFPMSKKPFYTKYDSYRRENEANMFAVAMNIRRHKAATEYINKIIWLRGMSLLNGDLQHYSAKAMEQVSDFDHDVIMNNDLMALLKLIKQLYKPLILTYPQYLQYRTNAVEAIHKLGRQVGEPEKPVVPKNYKPQPDVVQELIRQTRAYYKAFMGKECSLKNR